MTKLVLGIVLLAVFLYFLNVDYGFVKSKDDSVRLQTKKSLEKVLKPAWISQGIGASILLLRYFTGV